MNLVIKSLAATAVAVFSLAATAQPQFARHAAPEIDARLARQSQRIEVGFERGDLTRREYRALQRRAREIVWTRSRALADGRISPHEHRELVAMLDSTDAMIRELRHNGYERGGRDYDRRW